MEIEQHEREWIRAYTIASGGIIPKTMSEKIYADPELYEFFGLKKFEFTPRAKWLGNRYAVNPKSEEVR